MPPSPAWRPPVALEAIVRNHVRCSDNSLHLMTMTECGYAFPTFEPLSNIHGTPKGRRHHTIKLFHDRVRKVLRATNQFYALFSKFDVFVANLGVTSLDDQDPFIGKIFGQSASDDTSCRTTTNDDIVILGGVKILGGSHCDER